MSSLPTIARETVETLRRRFAGEPCEYRRCVLGLSHPGPCWLPDTDEQLDRYNELAAIAREQR
jgi:hypothetical protein